VARFADVYLQPRPGEDPALLAALLHVVIREGLVDRGFVREHVSGFAELEAAVAPFTPHFAAERAGVAAAEIERAARVFGGARRGCGVAGTGPNMAPRGNLTEYLLLCLNTVCGRWRRAGEPVANPGALLPKAVPVAQAQAPRRAFGFGETLRVRGLANSAAGLPTAALADEILEPGPGRIRALICVGSNPIAAWPDQHKTRRAMAALDLLVTLDMKLSATARLAHYVIAPKLSLEVPGLSFSMEALEHTYVAMGYSEPYAQYTPAIAAPPPGADVIEEWEFFYGLAQRMGLPVLEDFSVNGERPVTFQECLVDGLEQPYLEDLRGGTVAPYPAHVIQARDYAEALPDFKGIGSPIEHAVDVIYNHECGLPPTLELRKDRTNVARRRLDRHGLAHIAQADSEKILRGSAIQRFQVLPNQG